MGRMDDQERRRLSDELQAEVAKADKYPGVSAVDQLIAGRRMESRAEHAWLSGGRGTGRARTRSVKRGMSRKPWRPSCTADETAHQCGRLSRRAGPRALPCRSPARPEQGHCGVAAVRMHARLPRSPDVLLHNVRGVAIRPASHGKLAAVGLCISRCCHSPGSRLAGNLGQLDSLGREPGQLGRNLRRVCRAVGDPIRPPFRE